MSPSEPDTRDAVRVALDRVRTDGTYTAYLAAQNALAADPSGEPVRIAVLRNFTVEPILPVLEVELALSGLKASMYVGDFDAVAADALDPDGGLARSSPDVVILALWLEGLAPRLVGRFPSLTDDEVAAETQRVVGYVRDMLVGVRRSTNAPIIVNNFPLLGRPALGILDAQGEASQHGSILAIGRGLLGVARDMPDVFIADHLSVFANVGSSDGFDRKKWLHRRSPVGTVALAPLGREYARIIRALRGRVRKCVVVDCDDTLWGGVVGEDGPHGLALGEGPGAAYTALQRELLNLHDRGVLLAVCTKNNEADVLEVLDGHPEMLVRRSHLAAYRINWDDKASNLRAIASELNIGLDSMVFVDDSAFECGLVRESLPEVAVIHLDPAKGDLATQLTDPGWFDALITSSEDALRTAHFRAEATRRDIQSAASSLDEYLEHLGMVAEIEPASDATIPRIAQLTQKTNQFNLTTRRYTEADIRRYAESPSAEVLSMRLRDKVADLGIIAVAIVRYAGEMAEIDSFLMSCRALGRGAERVLFDEVCRRARERGCTRIGGVYLRTPKNEQVAGFYPSVGLGAEPADGPGVRFAAEIAGVRAAPSHINVVRGRHAEVVSS